jgi:hypothetical protein
MAGAGSALNSALDTFADGSYDPSIADAVNRLEAQAGIVPPAAITSVVAQTVDDPFVTTTLTLTTGTVQATLIGLVKGQVITNINLNSGAASVSQTHLWAAITNAGSSSTATVAAVLAVTADGTTVATTATAVQKMALASQWTVPSTGFYYVHVLATGTTTLPTFDAFAATAGTRGTQYPIVAGTGSTGQTTAPTVGANLAIPLSGGVTKGLAAWLN